MQRCFTAVILTTRSSRALATACPYAYFKWRSSKIRTGKGKEGLNVISTARLFLRVECPSETGKESIGVRPTAQDGKWATMIQRKASRDIRAYTVSSPSQDARLEQTQA